MSAHLNKIKTKEKTERFAKSQREGAHQKIISIRTKKESYKDATCFK